MTSPAWQQAAALRPPLQHLVDLARGALGAGDVARVWGYVARLREQLGQLDQVLDHLDQPGPCAPGS